MPDASCQKTLILASSRTPRAAAAAAAAGLRPRLDYLELAAALGADVLDTEPAEALPPWRRKIEQALSSDIRQAQVAWNRRGLYGAWLSTSEKVGLPLALHSLARRDPMRPHVLIAHNLTSERKRQIQHFTGVFRWGFTDIICLSAAQEDYLRSEAGLPPERVHRLTHNVDTRFYQPGGTEDGGYLLAVGRENRDYSTLIVAARTLALPLTIVASSLWAARGGLPGGQDLPPNVTLRQDFLSDTDLRDLYDRARVVIVPLNECAYAAGSTGLLEAMAMGKPVIVSQTLGLADYLTKPDTHVAVPPGDARALGAAVAALWDDAARRQALGQAARLLAVNQMSIEGYVAGVAAVVRRARKEMA